MAVTLSAVAEAYLNAQTKEPNIIIEIDGVGTIFGMAPVFEVLKIGSFVIGDGSKIGGVSKMATAKDYISPNGTTNNLSQQINIDSARGSSILSFKVVLIDKNSEITTMFKNDPAEIDMLGRKANVYYQFKGTAHPRDSIKIFVGVIDIISLRQGNISINIAHPDQLKRQELLPKNTAKVVTDSGSIIFCDDISAFNLGQDALTGYIRIDDEIILPQGSTSTDFLSCQRGQLNTVSVTHDADAAVESFYRLQGYPIELALKILISNPDALFFGQTTINRFVEIDSTTSIYNAIAFDEYDIKERLGLSIGDTVSVTGADNPSNFFSAPIIGFGKSSLGSYILVDYASMVVEKDSAATCTFKSKYNKLNFGCGISTSQIDIEQFEYVNSIIGSQHPALDIYIKDTIKADEFIEKELYFPFGMYSVPRKGKISISATMPPLAGAQTEVLSELNIKNAADISVDRTSNERFYNSIVYKFDIDSITDRFLAARIIQSSQSTNRIKVGNKTMTVESNGLRNNLLTKNLIDAISLRILDRYKFGAERINLGLNFKTGFKIEIGDAVIFDGERLRVSDSKSGTRDFEPRVMECVNKTVNLKTGDVQVELVDTTYSSDARYGTIGPSSKIKSGTTTSAVLENWDWSVNETDKWTKYLGNKVLIHNEDYSKQYETIIRSVDITAFNKVTFDAIAEAPTSGWYINQPNYSADKRFAIYKNAHPTFSKQDSIISSPDSTHIVVTDGSIYFVGAKLLIHNADFSDYFETTVKSIATNTIEIDTLPFAISAHYVDGIGFYQDNGKYYSYI